jgi:hypothetical protein
MRYFNTFLDNVEKARDALILRQNKLTVASYKVESNIIKFSSFLLQKARSCIGHQSSSKSQNLQN